jgi:hypothetical protein
MFWPKIAIIQCLKSSSYKETAVFATVIIDIDLLIVPCVFVWVAACSLTAGMN